MTLPLRAIIDAYDASLSLDRAVTIPSAWYTDRRIHDLEAVSVFGGTWQVAARLDQLGEPGCYVTTEIAGEPIVVVRGGDGVLRGFYNVCRHHAAAVVAGPCGRAPVLRCPYHGWTYSLEGSLQGTPEFRGVCDFDKTRHGLHPVRVDAWEHFVFVCLSADAPALPAFLAELADRVAPLEITSLRFVERRSYELACNWKVYVDNYLDGGYHVPHAHKSLNSVLDYANYTIENGARCCFQSTPLSASGGDPDTAAVRRGSMGYYYWLYPNFMLNWYEGVMDTNLVLPLGVDRTLVLFDFYFADDGAEALARNRQSMAVAERIQQEDIDICESVQRGLRSRAYDVGRLSVRREAGEHLFHRLLHQSLGDGLRGRAEG